MAYVVYDHDRAENVELIRDWLAEHDILLAGRYSEWEYYNSDHAFIAGKKAAQQVGAKSLVRIRRRRQERGGRLRRAGPRRPRAQVADVSGEGIVERGQEQPSLAAERGVTSFGGAPGRLAQSIRADAGQLPASAYQLEP